MYSNCCCSCSFEPESIKICQSSHKKDSNNILNFQESTTILNACTKKSGNNSIKHQSSVYMQISDQTIHFSISHLFALGLNVKQFYLTYRTLSGATTPGSEWTWEQWQWRSTPHSPKLCITGAWQSDCLMSYPEHLLGSGVLLLCRDAVGIFYSPRQLGSVYFCNSFDFQMEVGWLVDWLVLWRFQPFLGHLTLN